MPIEHRRIYVAAPLFNPAERAFNDEIAATLAPWLDVYLPQRDGDLLPKLVEEGLSATEARRHVFGNDIAAIKGCDALLIVLNGRTVDEGAAFELGVAWALGKTCIGYKDDFRRLVADGDNPMIGGALRDVFPDMACLRAWASEF